MLNIGISWLTKALFDKFNDISGFLLFFVESYKNFGETSLQEIRKILNQKNLRLGENSQRGEASLLGMDSEAQALLGEPVSILELSSRSQRCMDRLGIETIADLLGRNELELVSQKNFGVTSLNEVKRKLTERGLNLTTG